MEFESTDHQAALWDVCVLHQNDVSIKFAFLFWFCFVACPVWRQKTDCAFKSLREASVTVVAFLYFFTSNSNRMTSIQTLLEQRWMEFVAKMEKETQKFGISTCISASHQERGNICVSIQPPTTTVESVDSRIIVPFPTEDKSQMLAKFLFSV